MKFIIEAETRTEKRDGIPVTTIAEMLKLLPANTDVRYRMGLRKQVLTVEIRGVRA